MKKALRSPLVTGLLFVLAVALLMTGSIGGTRAALNRVSEIYNSQLQLKDIGVSLTENGEIISRRDYNSTLANGTWNTATGDLITKIVRENGTFLIGQHYDVKLGVKNTGSIPIYTRVTIYRYWVDAEGRKLSNGWFEGAGAKKDNQQYKPEYIKLRFTDPTNWVEDTGSTTAERTVLYYQSLLPVGEEKIFADQIWIDPAVASYVKETKTDNGAVYTYAFDGLGFVLDVQVDAVQDRHGTDAMRSAWGRTN